jgi:8-oxo-dGTP pyrophosphatase MutT (NUDIX family)
MTTREERFRKYFEVLALLPEVLRTPGSAERGEIQYVTDPAMMGEIEDAWRAEFQKKGLNPDHANIGIVYEDAVKWHLNDPVIVPAPGGGTVKRGWDRIAWKNGVIGKSIVVVPITPDGRVVMVPAYRHTAGRWELELPGGGSLQAKTHRECVKFELLEEAGYTAREIIPLEAEENGEPVAFFNVDPSVNVTPIRAYAVKVGKKVENAPEVGEVFGKAMLLNRAQLRDVFSRGYIAHPTLSGVRCYPQDGRNGYGLMLALLRDLIK